MRPATSQTLRRLGLAIEAACLLGLLTVARPDVAPRRFLRIDAHHGLMLGLALGFVLWLTGTATYYWPKRKTGGRS